MGDRPSEPVHLDEHARELYEAVDRLLEELDYDVRTSDAVVDVEAVMAKIRGDTSAA